MIDNIPFFVVPIVSNVQYKDNKLIISFLNSNCKEINIDGDDSGIVEIKDSITAGVNGELHKIIETQNDGTENEVCMFLTPYTAYNLNVNDNKLEIKYTSFNKDTENSGSFEFETPKEYIKNIVDENWSLKIYDQSNNQVFNRIITNISYWDEDDQKWVTDVTSYDTAGGGSVNFNNKTVGYLLAKDGNEYIRKVDWDSTNENLQFYSRDSSVVFKLHIPGASVVE